LNKDDQSLQRLLAAARKAPRTGDESAPFGFSTRVAALAFQPERGPRASLAGVSLRAAALAGLFAAAAVVLNFSAITGALEDEGSAASLAPSDDPVSEVVNLGS